MKVLVRVLAFVAYACVSSVSSYGSGVGLAGSPLILGSSGIGSNSGLGVKRLSSGNIGGFSGSSRYGSGIGLNKGQIIRQVSIPQSTLSTGNYGMSGINKNQGQVIRRVAVTQPSLTPISVQRPSISSGIGLNQGINRITVAQPPVITGRSLGISTVPVRSVSVVQPKLSTVHKVRPVTYSQPIRTIQPIQTVKVPSLPIITTQPISTVKVVARQPKITKSPINLSGTSFGSGLGIGQGQAVRRVTLSQSNLTPGIIGSGIKNQVNLKPVSFSQPKVTVQPIRTLQIPSQPIISSSKINLGRATYGSGLGFNQGKSIGHVSVVQPSLSSYGFTQPSLSAGNYGLTRSNYGIGRSTINSVPISTSSRYGLGSGITSINNTGKIGLVPFLSENKKLIAKKITNK